MTHAVATGPITGSLTMADGTTYDVSPYWVTVAEEHAAELADAVARHYVEHGHPADPNFIYNPEKV